MWWTQSLATDTQQDNPVLVELTRGGIVESRHRGAVCIAHADGDVLLGGGRYRDAVFPRSSIKAFQALAMVESGACDAFGFDDASLALSCSSHGGEFGHTERVSAMLGQLGLTEDHLECGAHWPSYQRRTNEMIEAGERPRQIHNNCSGKHAGMLAQALRLGVDLSGYVGQEHAVQKSVRQLLEELCEIDLVDVPVGTDGCSVPTWAMPLETLAKAFARFGASRTGSKVRDEGCRRIISAVRANPFMVAGTGRFCTEAMEGIPRLFVKTGAEGVFCGCIPEAGIGFALKCEDGTTRASDAATAGLLLSLNLWDEAEQAVLERLAGKPLLNVNRYEIGEIRSAEYLRDLKGTLRAAI